MSRLFILELFDMVWDIQDMLDEKTINGSDWCRIHNKKAGAVNAIKKTLIHAG